MTSVLLVVFSNNVELLLCGVIKPGTDQTLYHSQGTDNSRDLLNVNSDCSNERYKLGSYNCIACIYLYIVYYINT